MALKMAKIRIETNIDVDLRQLWQDSCQLRKDELSNSVIDTHSNCTQSKIPFYPIQNYIDIFNMQ